MRRAAILVWAIATGCRPDASTAAPGPAATAQPAEIAAPLRFAWPAGIDARVTERVVKKGRHATMRYRIAVEEDDDALLVYYRDFAFAEIEGFDLGDPAVRAEIRGLEEQLGGAIPPYRVAHDGTWIGATGIETLGQRFESVFSAKDREMFGSLLANPKVRALVDAKMREVWQAWAQGWIGLELQPGARYEGTAAVDVAGVRVEQPFVVERLVADDGVRLRATQTMAGEQAIAAVGAVIDEFIAARGQATKPLPLAATDVRRVYVREATLDPKTLLPRRASTHVTIAVTHEGQTTEQIESHEWVFDWRAR